MGLKHTGYAGIDDEVDARHRAGRVSLRPHDVGALGGYRVTALSGQIAASLAAGSELFQLRWTDATRKFVLHELQVGVVVDGTITAAVPIVLEAVVARAWSADGSGGSALTLTGSNGKMESGFGTTLVNAARIASTAALTVGTKTLDVQGFGIAVGGSGTTAGASTPIPMAGIFEPIAGVEPPLVLSTSEGFIIRSVLGGPATGTWRLAVFAAWSEMTSFNNLGQ
jgi:hypothetical protein